MTAQAADSGRQPDRSASTPSPEPQSHNEPECTTLSARMISRLDIVAALDSKPGSRTDSKCRECCAGGARSLRLMTQPSGRSQDFSPTCQLGLTTSPPRITWRITNRMQYRHLTISDYWWKIHFQTYRFYKDRLVQVARTVVAASARLFEIAFSALHLPEH